MSHIGNFARGKEKGKKRKKKKFLEKSHFKTLTEKLKEYKNQRLIWMILRERERDTTFFSSFSLI